MMMNDELDDVCKRRKTYLRRIKTKDVLDL